MNREFIINIVFLVFVNLLIKPFYLFGIDRGVQNLAEPGAYGLYFALFNFSYLFQILTDLGLQHFNNRNLSLHRQLLGKYLPDMLVLKGLLGLLFLLVVILAGLLSGYGNTGFFLLCWIALNQLLTSLILFLRSTISGLGYYRADSLFSVVDRLLLIGLVGAMLWVPFLRQHFRIEWFVWAQTAALGLTGLAAFLFIQLNSGRIRFRWRPRFWGLILRQSYPFALVIFLMTVYTRIDGVMIERMARQGALEADWYASAFRLLDAGNMIGFLFAGLLFPMFARLAGEKQALASLVDLSLKTLWAGTATLAAGAIVFRTEIMEALYHHGGPYSGAILAWLMLSFLALSGSYIYGALLGASGHLKVMNQIAMAGVALNIVLNLALIHRYQALGAAVATCFTQFLVFFAQAILATKRLHLPVQVGRNLRLLTFFPTALLICIGAYTLLPGSWVIHFLLALVLNMALALAFRLIDLPEALRLLREKYA